MRDHYDFSKMKGRKNPYTKYLKQPVTMRLDRDTVAYFKSMAEETNIPYQSLINLYLRDCAAHHRKLVNSGDTTLNFRANGAGPR